MGLNVVPADNQLNSVHYDDNARPRCRGRRAGISIRKVVQDANGACAITVWDPTSCRTTVRRYGLSWDYKDLAAPGDPHTL
jgi:hypothetical protein